MLAAAAAGALVALALAMPLAWKWELGASRCALAVAALAIFAGLSVAALDALFALSWLLATALVAALTLTLSGAAMLWRFYRDPERTPPDRSNAVVSPADGTVIYVHRSRRGKLPVSTKHRRPFVLEELVRTPLGSDDAVVVGIALSFLDVHVNRAPIAGSVASQRRYPGRFASLKDPAAVYANERATMILEQPGLQVAVVLIASRLVRRIVSFVREGENVGLGQRIGVIRFGSQVDLVLPDRDDVRVLVQPGQALCAGETTVAEVIGSRAGPGSADEQRQDESLANRREGIRLPSAGLDVRA
jgi:phosphatidylserine decarboxylase